MNTHLKKPLSWFALGGLFLLPLTTHADSTAPTPLAPPQQTMADAIQSQAQATGQSPQAVAQTVTNGQTFSAPAVQTNQGDPNAYNSDQPTTPPPPAPPTTYYAPAPYPAYPPYAYTPYPYPYYYGPTVGLYYGRGYGYYGHGYYGGRGGYYGPGVGVSVGFGHH